MVRDHEDALKLAQNAAKSAKDAHLKAAAEKPRARTLLPGAA